MLLLQRTLRVSATLVAFVVLAFAAGCGSSGEIELTAADDGRQIEMQQGQTLVVSLESNPSTGYRWERAPVEDEILQQAGEPEFRQGGRSGLVGTPGQQIFRFQAAATGTTRLDLVYHRPWEQEAKPEGIFSVTVVVR
ncbi:MAG: protease inhibitor I42 family protein [Anaerolineae bacterium]